MLILSSNIVSLASMLSSILKGGENQNISVSVLTLYTYSDYALNALTPALLCSAYLIAQLIPEGKKELKNGSKGL